MRKAITILSGLLIFIGSCNHTSTQPEQIVETQQPGFTGVYEFQINKTTVNDLDKLPYHIKEINIKEGITDVIKADRVERVTEWVLLCPGVRRFKLDDFDKGTVHFKNISLTFYRDTLITFSAEPDYSIKDLLKAKHPDYIEPKGKDYALWYTNSVMAVCAPNGEKDAFLQILDTAKNHKALLKADTEKADYLKKLNAGL